MDAATWIVEWGLMTALLFVLISLLALIGHLFERNLFAVFALALGFPQAGFHDYFFAFLMGPIVLLAMGQVQWASVRSQLRAFLPNRLHGIKGINSKRKSRASANGWVQL